jgi:hypothetical protein
MELLSFTSKILPFTSKIFPFPCLPNRVGSWKSVKEAGNGTSSLFASCSEKDARLKNQTQPDVAWRQWLSGENWANVQGALCSVVRYSKVTEPKPAPLEFRQQLRLALVGDLSKPIFCARAYFQNRCGQSAKSVCRTFCLRYSASKSMLHPCWNRVQRAKTWPTQHENALFMQRTWARIFCARMDFSCSSPNFVRMFLHILYQSSLVTTACQNHYTILCSRSTKRTTVRVGRSP